MFPGVKGAKNVVPEAQITLVLLRLHQTSF